VGRDLLLFDGDCGLCDRLVRLVAHRDLDGRFDLAPLQGPTARETLARLGRAPPALDTLLVIADYREAAPRVLERSAAALQVAAALGPPLSWLRALRRLPPTLLDRAYDLVARHRRRLGGAAACAPPDPAVRGRFLDLDGPPGGAAHRPPGA
jgi:predicted DCC family thiol-disulfide oxidoreductase YuxK